jgi:hypothetical protein
VRHHSGAELQVGLDDSSKPYFPFFDDANEAVVENVSAVIHHRDSADNDFSTAIDIHPALFWR